MLNNKLTQVPAFACHGKLELDQPGQFTVRLHMKEMTGGGRTEGRAAARSVCVWCWQNLVQLKFAMISDGSSSVVWLLVVEAKKTQTQSLYCWKKQGLNLGSPPPHTHTLKQNVPGFKENVLPSMTQGFSGLPLLIWRKTKYGHRHSVHLDTLRVAPTRRETELSFICEREQGSSLPHTIPPALAL